MQMSYKGEILNPMLYDMIDRLDYSTGKYFDDGTEIMASTGCIVIRSVIVVA